MTQFTYIKILKFSAQLILFTILSSCSGIVHSDSIRMRDHAVKYYDTQIMDNLVRAAEGRLILHVEIDQLTTTSKANTTSTLGGGRTSATETAPLGAVTRLITKPLSYSLQSQLEGSVQSAAKPNVKDPEIYASYLQFISLQSCNEKLSDVESIYHNPENWPKSIACSKVAPLPGTFVTGTHIVKDGMHYCIPKAYSRAYFELCMALTGRLIISEKRSSQPASQTTTSSNTRTRSGFRKFPEKPSSVDTLIEDKARQELFRLEQRQ